MGSQNPTVVLRGSVSGVFHGVWWGGEYVATVRLESF